MTRSESITELRRELRDQRRLITRLARALYTHTRTDIAPDAALPAMKKIVDEARGSPPPVTTAMGLLGMIILALVFAFVSALVAWGGRVPW